MTNEIADFVSKELAMHLDNSFEISVFPTPNAYRMTTIYISKDGKKIKYELGDEQYKMIPMLYVATMAKNRLEGGANNDKRRTK